MNSPRVGPHCDAAGSEWQRLTRIHRRQRWSEYGRLRPSGYAWTRTLYHRAIGDQ